MLSIRIDQGGNPVSDADEQHQANRRWPISESGAAPFIVPNLRSERPVTYNEDVRAQFTTAMRRRSPYLAAKLSRSGTAFPGMPQYVKTCESIPWLRSLPAVPSQNGQMPGIYLPDLRRLRLTRWGGVRTSWMLCRFAVSDNKLSN